MTTTHNTDEQAPIAAQVAQLKAGMADHLPAEVSAAFAAEQAGLAGGPVPASVLPVGSPLPVAELLDTRGASITVAEAAAGRPAVVVFYRGGWCPYCNIALRTYQQQLIGELTERGVALVAISPQRADDSLSTREKQELSFSVLSDPGNRIATALGILTAPTEEARAGQAKLGMDLAEVNADGTRNLPMPTVALLDAAGVIRWIDVHPDYTTRTEPAQVLTAVDALLG